MGQPIHHFEELWHYTRECMSEGSMFWMRKLWPSTDRPLCTDQVSRTLACHVVRLQHLIWIVAGKVNREIKQFTSHLAISCTTILQDIVRNLKENENERFFGQVHPKQISQASKCSHRANHDLITHLMKKGFLSNSFLFMFCWCYFPQMLRIHFLV